MNGTASDAGGGKQRSTVALSCRIQVIYNWHHHGAHLWFLLACFKDRGRGLSASYNYPLSLSFQCLMAFLVINIWTCWDKKCEYVVVGTAKCVLEKVMNRSRGI